MVRGPFVASCTSMHLPIPNFRYLVLCSFLWLSLSLIRLSTVSNLNHITLDTDRFCTQSYSRPPVSQASAMGGEVFMSFTWGLLRSWCIYT